jgi:hypothetical protein
MAGDTGYGQEATVFSQLIPNVKSITTENTGEVIEESVADGKLTAVVGTGWGWQIQFIAPTTGTHTLETAIKAGTTGAITIESGKTKYTSANGRSGGFTKNSDSKAFIVYNLRIVIDGDPTLAAVV